ncbi:hypothetical protein KGY77_08305 [Candidatus Bipolaricaulota bacterium]|nr:hypothetical protein [Candidatus Bipolaricaulota bacterium]
MEKSKLLIVASLAISLILSVGLAAQANSDYGDKASKILEEISAQMKAFSADKKAMNNGTKSLQKLLDSAEERKKKAFDQLKKVAELNAKTDDMKFQFILWNVAEKWYSTTKKWHDALAGIEQKLESLGKDMTLIAENMVGIGELAKEKQEESSN